MHLPLFVLALALARNPSQTSNALTVRAEGPSVIVNEVSVLTLRATVAGLPPERRTEALAQRLRDAGPATPLSIKAAGQGRLLMGGDKVLLEISPSEAKEQISTPSALAKQWMAAIQSAMALPPLKLEPKSVLIPLGSESTLSMVGSAAGAATVTAADPAVVSIERHLGTIVLKAIGKGTTTLSIVGTGVSDTVSVRVQPYAAKFPQNFTATVTGAPTAPDVLASVLRGVVRTGLQAEPGTKFEIANPADLALGVGETKSIPLKVKVNGVDSLPAEGLAIVRVSNAGLASREETALWYCNEPENIKGPGALFRGELRPEEPVRMLYHHIDASAYPILLDIEVRNPSDSTARLMIIPGDSMPNKNAVLAGVQAADPFFQAWLSNSGEIVTIPPHSRMPLSFHPLRPTECASGLAYLRLLPAGPERLLVHADARPLMPLTEPWLSAANSNTPWRETGTPDESDPLSEPLSNLVFARPFLDTTVDYQVGGKYAFGRIGHEPIARVGGGRPLDGNFGVTYRIIASATNPTNQPADVEVVFDASAGYSGALFTVDGVYKRLPLLQPKGEYQLAQWHLAPGEKRSVRLTTIPLSGSSYPATIQIRPVDKVKALPK